MTDKKVIRVQVYRSPSSDRIDAAQEGEYREYEVPYEERMTVMNVLDIIQEDCDRSLTFYKSCRIGRCSGCLVSINGKSQFSCSTLARDDMKIGPAPKYKVIRDLVTKFPG